MANKKLKNFEFANHTEKGSSYEVNTDEVAFFDCVNGSVFLICQDNGSPKLNTSPANLAAQRLKYYLENEFVADPANALYNALVYTNGFIYEYGRKNDEYKGAWVKCTVVLIRDGQVYYSSFGELSVTFFNGRRSFLVSHGELNSPPKGDMEGDEDIISGKSAYLLLGQHRDIKPVVNKDPLVPMNDDLLLFGTKGFYDAVNEKSIVKILSDPMPVQTKVYRLVDMANMQGGVENITIQLISFYNLENQDRKFHPVEIRRSAAVKNTSPSEKKEANTNFYGDKIKETLMKSPVKEILLGIGILFLIYMVYDLFIYDPMPANRVKTEKTTNDTAIEESKVEPETIIIEAASKKSIPADTLYTVRAGDTWSRIYTHFGVCSWFIRSHTDNAGKFDADENPIAGRRIVIPLLYSAKRQLNPEFYQEFSLEKTGSRCENANQEFIEAFRSANL
jgi:hypothetical protein